MSDGTFMTKDGCRLAFVDEGQGLPVLWQHGLGADRNQPAEVFPAMDCVRRVTLECRGHGASELGNPDAISIQQFADDALALLDHLDIKQAVVGGISLGAAIALRLAALHPERTAAMILARPAWVDEQGPEHLRIYRDVASLLNQYGAAEGLRRLEEAGRLKVVEEVSPDNAASMRWFFTRANPESTVALLSRIPAQGPAIPRADIKRLALPTLVIANGEDYVHSVATAKALSELIPQSTLRVITSKTVSRQSYVTEFRRELHQFIEQLRSE